MKIRTMMVRRGGLQLDLVPPSSFYNRQQVNSSSVRVRRRREGEGKKKRERHSGDFSNWRGGGGGERGEDKWSKRVEDQRRAGSSKGCSGEFMFNRSAEERKKKLFEEQSGNYFSPAREEEKCAAGWRVCLSEETRMPALSLQKEAKGEKLLKRTLTMLEEGRRKVDFRGREVKKEIWRGLEEEKLSLTRTRGDEKEVATKR